MIIDDATPSTTTVSPAFLIPVVAPVISILVNVTVDDQHGDPTTGLVPEYLPSDGTVWHGGSPTENCTTCNIKPSTLDLNQIHDQTWHDGTNYPPGPPTTITVQFTGSAVYVFNILPNTLPDTDTYSNISFSIDGEDAAIFIHTPDSSSTILYNQLVYQNAMLQHGPHTLVMSAAGTVSSLILFDYLLYTTRSNDTTPTLTTVITNPTQTSSFNTESTHMVMTRTSTPSASPPLPSSTSPTGAVIGGVVGGIAFLLWVAIWVLLLHRRRTLSKSPQNQGWWANIASIVPLNRVIPSSRPEPNIRCLDGPSADTDSPGLRRDFSGLDACHLPAAEAPISLSLAVWAKRHIAELIEKFKALQSARLRPSSESFPNRPRMVMSHGSGRDAVIRGLETEIAALRGGLAALRAQWAEEPLPAYVE